MTKKQMSSKSVTYVVGYVRISTENQIENYSIDEQIARLKAYCAAKGWVLVHIYVDAGYSGGNTERPELQKMLKAIRETQVDAVVVYKLDRLSRSQKDTLTLIEDELLAHGTDFVSINENFDTSTPFGRAMIGILSVFAQLEKDQITERFTMGRIGRGKAGYFHGGGNAPTGYDYVDGDLQVNEYEATQVREVFALFLAGKSINAIWHIMSEKYATKWTATKVRNVLMNSLYIGKVKFLNQEYDGVHTPIIDPDTYMAANRLLESFDRENAKSTSQKNPFRAGYLLSGLVYCGQCGARYSANHGYYKCYSRAKSSPKYIVDPNCKNDNWEIPALDTLVINQVDSIVTSQTLLDGILRQADSKRVVQIDKHAIQKRIDDIDTQVDRLIDLYQVSKIPVETLNQKINSLTSEKDTLVAQISAPDEVPSTALFLSAVNDFRSGFSQGDLEAKRLILSSLIDRIAIDGQSVKVSWRL